MDTKDNKFQSAADLMQEQAEKLEKEVAKKSKAFESAADLMEKQASKLVDAQDDAEKKATNVTNLMAEQMKKVAGGDKENRHFASKALTLEYTVATGDSLSSIAKSELGDASHWKALYDANKEVIGNDPNRIRPGQVLTLPQID